ncbi:MAG: hypothetical protein KAQ92_08280, partial [Candidatus Aenigmarchaeota archaeon]|nr:hypothetical protein [Candidatus Aenigmarchaeota archaeon]
EINNENFKLKLVKFTYSPNCELNKKYFLNKCFKKGDSIKTYDKKTFVSLNYAVGSYPYNREFKRNKDIEINEFAKILNMKVINKQWYEYIPAFIMSFVSGFTITLLIAGSVYGIFLLFVWIFSGFKPKN